MPKAAELPDSLNTLPQRNGQHLRPEPDFDDSARQLIAHVAQHLGVTPQPFGPDASAQQEKPPKAIPADISRIFKYAPAELIGRMEETKLLSGAWDKVVQGGKGRPHVLTFVALGGEGKTSLVAKWAADLAHQDWPGCAAAFAWSFYSQGTRDQLAASSDLFLKESLTFFGDDADKEFAASPAGAFEKGQRLARILGQGRSLLILDGLEPLQYAPTSPTPGQLKDQGIAALLKGLAGASHGLCVVTTRYSLPDLKAFWQTTAPEVKLLRLSREAGVHLLKTLGVRGTAKEFETLVEDVKGHALTLTLLGGFLKRAFHGDIRKRDRVKFEIADEKMDGGHAFRTMAAYEQWLLRDGGDEGRREVAVLRLLGLFDRPADAGCLKALLQPPLLKGLTEPLIGLAEDEWQFCLTGLESAKLLTIQHDASTNPQSEIHSPQSLDAHPHLREYFARQLRTQQPDVWRAAHRRLYEHLCATTKEGDQPTLESLQPLYQAIVHGCQAALYPQVWSQLYRRRIQRDDAYFAFHQLGAFGLTLAALTGFYEQCWETPKVSLSKADCGELLNNTGYALWSLGRSEEAMHCLEAALATHLALPDWKESAIDAENLAELNLTTGNVNRAVKLAIGGVEYADRSSTPELQRDNRAILGHALHQAGRLREARVSFDEAALIARTISPPVSEIVTSKRGSITLQGSGGGPGEGSP